MSFLAPWGLLLGLLAIPIVLLYMLRLRRKDTPVSSTLLWQMLLRDRQANAPWQRLKRSLLLLLQLLILAALVLAFARPVQRVRSVAAGSQVILLDASASMSAVDVSPTRFEAAKAIVRGLIQALPSNAQMTLILASQQPAVLASAEHDRTTLLKALDAAHPSQGEADWQTAFSVASGAAGKSNSAEAAAIIIISDGGLPPDGLPPLPGEVRYIPVGSSLDNLAISALALRSANNHDELFASVTNYSSVPREVVLSFFIAGMTTGQDTLFKAQTIRIPASGQTSVTETDLPTPAQSNTNSLVYLAKLSRSDGSSQPLDALPLDDTAFAVSQPPARRRALLVTRENLFLAQALNSIQGLAAYQAIAQPALDGSGESTVQLPSDAFDLYVLDGLLPTAAGSSIPALPSGNLLLVNPPLNPLFSVTGVFTQTQNAMVTESPLTQYLDWSRVQVKQARHVDLPAWAQVLVRVDGGALVFTGETQGRRVAVLTFDLHDSDLPLQIAFPILISNLVNYLIPPQAFDAPEGLQPGQSLVIRTEAGVNQVAVAAPDNTVTLLTPGENGVTFSGSGELGVYAVSFIKPSSGTANQPIPNAAFFAVNLFSPSESDIQPRPGLHIGRSEVTAAVEEKLGQRDLWPWLALVGLAVLMLEWWVYFRRQDSTPLKKPPK